MANEKNETENAPAALTREDVEKMAAEIANRAAADHAKRTAARYEKQLEEQKARYETELAELRAKPKDEPEAEPKDKKAPKEDPYRKEMEARFAALEKERETERAAAAKMKADALAAEERSSTLEALKEVGVSGAPAQAAHLLLRAEGRLGRDDDGKLVFLVPKEGYTDKLTIMDGVKAWAESDTGKSFLPAKGLGGSGNKGGNGQQRKTGAAPTRSERVAEARRALMESFLSKDE